MTLWCSMTELSLCLGLILIILYGLFSLSPLGPTINKGSEASYNGSLVNTTAGAAAAGPVGGQLWSGLSPLQTVAPLGATQQPIKMVNLHLKDVYFFSRLWPTMLLLGYIVDFVDSQGGLHQPFMDKYLDAAQQVVLSDNSNATLAYAGAFSSTGPIGVGLGYAQTNSVLQYNGIDVLLIGLTVVIMQSFKSFESVLLLLLAFVGQLFMLHSCDFVSFYICLEAQNFAFLVLCGLQPRVLKYSTSRGSRPLVGVEASIKYLLLSAFSSGVLLFWFSILYLRTGITTLSWGSLTALQFEGSLLAPAGASGAIGASMVDIVPQIMILIALMFKLGGAPLHIWMVDIYSGVKRQLLMYLSTAPKLSLFGFWVSTWHSVWTDFTIFLFVALSMIIGCFGAYNQPTLRALFAYSTINEIGLMLMAIETAGFHSMFQHLSIYIITMLLLWNISDHRLFSILAVSLAGMPPLAGFFGKAWIFNSVAAGAMAGPYLGLLIISLFCTGLSLVYYLRVFRLFTMQGPLGPNGAFGTRNGENKHNNVIYPVGVDGNVGSPFNMSVATRTHNINTVDFNIKLTSFCVIFLFFAPLFYIKPFVL